MFLKIYYEYSMPCVARSIGFLDVEGCVLQGFRRKLGRCLMFKLLNVIMLWFCLHSEFWRF